MPKNMWVDLDIPATAAERVALEDANRECQCPKCGRLHRKLANNPPASIADTGAREKALEEAAQVAENHKSDAARSRQSKGVRFSTLSEETQASIRDEERGEEIASEMIAKAIRALAAKHEGE